MERNDFASYLQRETIKRRTIDGTVTVKPRVVVARGIDVDMLYDFAEAQYEQTEVHYDTGTESRTEIISDITKTIEGLIGSPFDVKYLGSPTNTQHKFRISESTQLKKGLEKPKEEIPKTILVQRAFTDKD
jgi:hypothetical protein